MCPLEDRHVSCCPGCGIPGEPLRDVRKFKGFSESSRSGEVLYHPDFDVIQCAKCKLYYKSDVPELSALIRYYENLNTDYENVDIVFPTDRIVLKYLNTLPPNISILDYGCGTGRLLSRLSNDVSKYGIEINPEAAAIATTRGVKIISEENMPDYGQRFDAILLTDVFEHLFEPAKILRLLNDALKPMGVLIISTGLANSVAYMDRIGYYWYFRLFSHLQMASSEYFSYLQTSLKSKTIASVRVSHYHRSFRIVLKKFVAEQLFRLYNNRLINKTFLPSIASVKKWQYPIFDMYNRDHIVCIMQKSPHNLI